MITLRVQTVVDFLREHRGGAFANWTDEAMADYVDHHAKQQTMACVAGKAGLAALVVGWGQDEPHQVPFAWQANNPNGYYWWWDQLIGVNSRAALIAIAVFANANRRCMHVPGLAIRHGRLKTYRVGHFAKLYKIGRRLYGDEHRLTSSA
jgi:hypothetical protein